MAPAQSKQATLQPFTQVSLDAPIQLNRDAMVTGQPGFAALDQFYIDMLESFSPEAKKARYLSELQREIEAVFRNDGIMIAVLFSDMTLECYSPDAARIIDALNTAPLSLERITHLLQAHFGDRLSVEHFCDDRPSYADLKKGVLYSKRDRQTGFQEDHSTLEEHMCDWLGDYQQWIQDYLCFTLAKISAEGQARK